MEVLEKVVERSLAVFEVLGVLSDEELKAAAEERQQ